MRRLIAVCLFIMICFHSAHMKTVEPKAKFNQTEQKSVLNFNWNALIYPGTLWCGHGDIAENSDQLGVLQQTDACCRSHDGCDKQIKGFETNYGLTNYSPFTKLHCDCEMDFRKCLKDSTEDSSDIVGVIYFNLNDKCFKSVCRKRRYSYFGISFGPCIEEGMAFVDQKGYYSYFV